MKPSVLKFCWMLSAFAPLAPAAAEEARDTAAAASVAIVEKAFAEINDSNPQKAIDLVEPLIAADEQMIAKERRRVYCGMSTTETVGYMLLAASDKKDAVAVDRGVCDALFAKAFALVDLNRTAEAQAAFKHLLELAPSHSQYAAELANTYRLQKDWQASLAAYETAEGNAGLADKDDIANRTCIALRGQGYVLVELGRWDDATRAYRKCLKTIPKEPKSLAELGYIAEHRPK